MKKALLVLCALSLVTFSCKKREAFCWACVNTYSYADNPPYSAHTSFDTTYQCNLTEDEMLNFKAQYPEQHNSTYTKYAMECAKEF